MTRLPGPRDPIEELKAQIAELQQQVAELGRANPLKFATISGGDGLTIEGAGGITVTDGGGIDIEDGGRFNAKHPDSVGGDDAFSAGAIRSEVDGSILGYGLMVQQADGTDILSARTDAAVGSAVTIRDSAGNPVMYTNGPGGLAAPLLAYPMYPYSSEAWPSTTSGTFTGMVEGYARKAAQSVQIGVTTVAESGTDGEARVLINGVPAGPVIPIGASIASQNVVVPCPGPWHGSVSVLVEARRTSGTGLVRAISYYMETVPTT